MSGKFGPENLVAIVGDELANQQVRRRFRCDEIGRAHGNAKKRPAANVERRVKKAVTKFKFWGRLAKNCGVTDWQSLNSVVPQRVTRLAAAMSYEITTRARGDA